MGDPDRRGWFWGCIGRPDRDGHSQRRCQADSEAVTTPELSELWDRMTPGIAAAIAQGRIIDCDNGADETYSRRMRAPFIHGLIASGA